VSLNPLPHIRREPFGMVLVPLLSYAYGHWMLGWASAPYDAQWAARFPRRAGAMALAGPLGNLTLLVLAAIGIRVGNAVGVFTMPVRLGFDHLAAATQDGMAQPLAALLSVFFSLNLILFFFNLLPVPPLDGGHVAQSFMPYRYRNQYAEVARYAPFALLALLAIPALQVVFVWPAEHVTSLVYRGFSHLFGPA